MDTSQTALRPEGHRYRAANNTDLLLGGGDDPVLGQTHAKAALCELGGSLLGRLARGERA